MTDSLSLLPCPFCGGEGCIIPPVSGASHWLVECLRCEALVIGKWQREAVIEAWNRRTALSLPEQRVTPPEGPQEDLSRPTTPEELAAWAESMKGQGDCTEHREAIQPAPTGLSMSAVSVTGRGATSETNAQRVSGGEGDVICLECGCPDCVPTIWADLSPGVKYVKKA